MCDIEYCKKTIIDIVDSDKKLRYCLVIIKIIKKL